MKFKADCFGELKATQLRCDPIESIQVFRDSLALVLGGVSSVVFGVANTRVGLLPWLPLVAQ